MMFKIKYNISIIDNYTRHIKNIESCNWLQVIHDHNLMNGIRGNNIETKIPEGFFFSKYSSVDEF